MIKVGIDEVGRGPLAGPLAAAAVVLDRPIAGLNDSKKLNHKQRAHLSRKIKGNAKYIGIGWASAPTIDRVGLTKATSIAMNNALNQIKCDCDSIIIDGNFNYLKGTEGVETVVGGDGTVPEVSAASIIAKVARDEYMKMVARLHPEYSFQTHVGYSTATHKRALNKHGRTVFHRTSFKPVFDLI